MNSRRQSLTTHRIAITKAQRLLIGKLLYLELALMGDDTWQQERMWVEVNEAGNALSLAVETLKSEYDLNGVSLPEEKQLI
jgi:hypothetical protein